MNRIKQPLATLLIALMFSSCASYNAYKQAAAAEVLKDWDTAVVQYERALEIDPDNREYKVALDRARREASRAHFEKGKVFRAESIAAKTADEQYRLSELAATELQITVKLDPTNQFAAVEFSKALQMMQDLQRAAAESTSIDEIKKRAAANISKAQPPQLNPASNEPISLTFSRDTPIKDIYRALGNAFGINVLFDQAVKDDRITIELRDVTAQQALERVMQAGNHFYKVLDEKTIIVVPDNPQARRDYEDLVIRTFYLSNGDAEQVTNVVRTMIEARNVFPLKALNAITIRDTADKVKIAEKIIEANDKAKAEVVVQVELVQLDISRLREIGMAISGFPTKDGTLSSSASVGLPGGFTGGTLSQIQDVVGSLNKLHNNASFTIPTVTYSLLKSYGNSELLANPELRISEGEKATLHIGQRVPVPVTTISGYNTTQTNNTGNNLAVPYTSFQYQDVGIKVGMEPRVHHNREVTLKLTVEVSNQGPPVTFAGQEQPTFTTRTIESTIRLKDGETNFLAGLIQSNKIKSATKTPILGDIPLIGRLFTNESRDESRTDLVLTMTPHIVRIPDITEEDVAPMWVGTGNNLTFRGVSPRIESQIGADPFVLPSRSQQFADPNAGRQLAEDGEPGNYIVPEQSTQTPPMVQPDTRGGMPSNPFNPPPTNPPNPNNPPEIQKQNPPSQLQSQSSASSESTDAAEAKAMETAALRLSPRIAPQPSTIHLGPGETRLWNIVGMDLDGLVAPELVLNFDPRAMDVTDVAVGSALKIDPALPPIITVDKNNGTIRVKSSNGAPLQFVGGGDVLAIRVHGGVTGETFLVLKDPELRTPGGRNVVAAVAGGRAKVQ